MIDETREGPIISEVSVLINGALFTIELPKDYLEKEIDRLRGEKDGNHINIRHPAFCFKKFYKRKDTHFNNCILGFNWGGS
jgi:hypothetical protein